MLSKIQAELKAPKGQYNSFGKYKYRSCEDIVEAVKPILHKNNVSLIITDDIVQIGERIYVKATAKIVGKDMNIIAETTAFAREEETKKGMDASQITGAASSYARKYALNGLFAIDDTKDADTQDNSATSNDYIAELAKINTVKELSDYYKKNNPKYKSHAFNNAVVARQNEIKALEKTNEVA
jgi:hypothetical protein